MIESTNAQYEKQIAEKDAQVAIREAALKTKESEIAKAKETFDEQIAERLKSERTAIAAEEAEKAKVLLAHDLEAQANQIAELQAVLKERDGKLAEAQKKAQADLIRKQRELDDATREMDLTIEKRVQESSQRSVTKPSKRLKTA